MSIYRLRERERERERGGDVGCWAKKGEGVRKWVRWKLCETKWLTLSCRSLACMYDYFYD